MELLSTIITGRSPAVQRLRTEEMNHGFVEERMFSFSGEFTINATPLVYKLSTVVPILLREVAASVDSGAISVKTYCHFMGTEGGVFDSVLDLNPLCFIQGLRSVSAVLKSGGTFTQTQNPGCVLRLRSSGATAQANSLSDSNQHVRGLPSGDYYFVLTPLVSGDCTGTLRIIFEELDQWPS